ncbi:MAG: ComEA family DNA-binding protein [Lachnospiraceae bacterium]|nr:ComEA family DNA-binding protein [Lachnospiraceae bacterium]
MRKERQRNEIGRAVWRRAAVCVVRRWLAGMVFLAALIIIVGVLTGCGGRGSAVVIEGGGENAVESTKEEGRQESTAEDTMPEKAPQSAGSEAAAGEEADTPQEKRIFVHVCGEVCRPGVYELAEGSRVQAVVEAAGGLTQDAAPEAVNLAAVVTDGSKVTIPSRQESSVEAGETTQGSWYETPEDTKNALNPSKKDEAGGSAALVDINRAGVAELLTIPGIGETRAGAIIAYREEYGPFGEIEDIMKVTGIKDGLFSKIRDYITVGG